jgi:hypothetical protein
MAVTMLAAHHLEALARSGIDLEQATARGYETITDRARLTEIKVTPAGRRTPGLLVPLLDIRGSTWGYQYRPDSPRMTDGGRLVKYETPTGQRNGLDVPAGVGEQLDDPSIPLWVTEGSKKADCAAAHGLCCVALSGVWNWRGTNGLGGKVALPDWNDVALNGRRVIIAYDGDVARKKSVRAAMVAIGKYLATRGAASVEYLHLPDDDDGKTGLDDYLMAHSAEELWHLVKPTVPPATPVSEQNTHGDTYPQDSSATAQPHRSTAMPEVARLRRILDKFATDAYSQGLVGEERTAKIVYLALTSRLLDELVSLGIKGHSASGKSYTVATVAKFFPEEAYLEYTAMSEHALIYSNEDYRHRSLIMYEATALREGRADDDMTSYFVRTLLSEGRLKYPVTIRDPQTGKFTSTTVVKEGPTNLIVTTTKTQIHAENETRILSLNTDDSTDQTKRVMVQRASEANGAGDLRQWHDLQRWLAGAQRRVTIPYAIQLAQEIPPIAVRLRRDFGSLLALIRAHTMLHQATRQHDDDGRIVATLDDYCVVRDLVADIMAEGVGATVPDTVRQTVKAVAALNGNSKPGEGVAARAIADRLQLDKSNVSRRLRMAADGGYLRNLEDKRGKPGRWVMGDPLPESVDLLPDPELLRDCATVAPADNTVDLGSCAVAQESREERDVGQNAELPECWDCGTPSAVLDSRSRCPDCATGACP